jgi:NAD(P)-dependent dehydrogenase (short-subunit alcohol dehydrogenase family)
LSKTGFVGVVTGASSGIGRAIAEDLSKSGWRLHLLGRRADALREVVGDHTPWTCELSDDDNLRTTAASIAKAGPVDLLIHSAGVVTLGPVAEAPIDELDLNLAINLRAPVLLTQLLLPRLKQARGQVVFINSGAGLAARAGWGHYAASKHAVRAIADSLRDEVRTDGIRVMTCYPGRTATPMQVRVRELEGQPYDAADYATPQDVARVVCEALALPRTAELTELKVRPGPG